MTDQSLAVDSVEHDTTGIGAEETDGEHVGFANPNADSRQLRRDDPSNDEATAVWLDDHCAAIRTPIGARPLTFVYAWKVRRLGRRLFRRAPDLGTGTRHQQCHKEQSGRTHCRPP